MWARRQAIAEGQGDFALEKAGSFLEFFERYLNVTYRLKKLGEISNSTGDVCCRAGMFISEHSDEAGEGTGTEIGVSVSESHSLCICLFHSLFLSACLSVFHSLCLSVCLSVSLCLILYVYLSVRLSLCLILYVYLSVCLPSHRSYSFA